MIDKIINTLTEYYSLKQTLEPDEQYSLHLLRAKREAETAIIKLIDSRIKTNLGRERRLQSNVNKNATIEALDSAPMPPDNPAKWLLEDPLGWMETYTCWYNTKRGMALNVKDDE